MDWREIELPKNELRYLRKTRGLTQVDIATRTGLTRQTVGLIESGKYNPSLRATFAILGALGVSFDQLYPDTNSLVMELITEWADGPEES